VIISLVSALKSTTEPEAVGGQMYLAVLVTRLVSLYSKQVNE